MTDRERHLEDDLRRCRRALLEAAPIINDEAWHARHAKTVQQALDSESAHNNVDDGDLYGRRRRRDG